MFSRLLKTELQNPWLYIVTVLLLVLSFTFVWDCINLGVIWEDEELMNPPATVFMQFTIRWELGLLLVAAACFPVSMSAGSMWKDGLYRQMFSRTTWWRYAWRNVLVTALVGGLVVFIPYLCIAIYVFINNTGENVVKLTEIVRLRDTFGINRLGATPAVKNIIFPAMEALDAEMNTETYESFFVYEICRKEIMAMVPEREFILSEIRIVLLKLVGYFALGAQWSLVGLAVSVWLPNRYAILTIPAFLSQAMQYTGFLVPRKYVEMGIVRYPLMQEILEMHASAVSGHPLWFSYLPCLCICGIAFAVYCIGLERRSRNG